MPRRFDRNDPATIHDDRSPWLIAARIAQSPAPVGAPMARYATPRGRVSPENRRPGANALVVKRLTSPVNGRSAKNDATAVVADWLMWPKNEPSGATLSSSVSTTTMLEASFKMLRGRWRSRHAASVCG